MTDASQTVANAVQRLETWATADQTRIQQQQQAGNLTATEAGSFQNTLQTIENSLQQSSQSGTATLKSVTALATELGAMNKQVNGDVHANETGAIVNKRLAEANDLVSKLNSRVATLATKGDLTTTQVASIQASLQGVENALQQSSQSGAATPKSVNALLVQLADLRGTLNPDVGTTKAEQTATNRAAAYATQLSKLSDRISQLVSDGGLTSAQNTQLQAGLGNLQAQVAAIDPSQQPSASSLHTIEAAIIDEQRLVNQDITANRQA